MINSRQPIFDVVVIMPVYKPGINFLNQQLESISNQDAKKIICIVGFDGPVDVSVLTECSLLEANDIFLVHQYGQHVGLYHHIERLLLDFSWMGKFVSFSDQDDIWFENRLSSQMKTLKLSGCSMITDNANLIDSNDKNLGIDLFSALKISSDSPKYVLLTNFATGAGSMFTTETISEALPFPRNHGRAVHDHWLASVAAVKNGCVVNASISWSYRQHGTNQIGANRGESRFKPVKSAIIKFGEIVFAKDRTVEIQVIENIKAIKSRFHVINSSCLDPTGSFGALDKIRLLNPKSLTTSRLDVIRVILSRFKTAF
jgi:hypothetical protein